MSRVRTLSKNHTFLESPRWHDGNLYVSDFFTRRILKFSDGQGEPEVVATVAGMPSGIGFLPDGAMLVVSMEDQTVYKVDDGGLTSYADLRGRVRGALNDMLVDEDGRCYIGNTAHSAGDESDFGPTPLLVVQPDGEIVESTEQFNFPNGIIKSSDGELLVAETYAGTVRAVELDRDGLPKSSRVWAHWGPAVDYYDIPRAHEVLDVEPDGLCAGAAGAVWVADAKGRGIALVREGGEVVDFVEVDDLSVFAALAVDSRLFLCCSPRNRTVDWSTLTSSELRVADI